MRLRDYIRVLREQWRVGVAVLLLCVLAGAFYVLAAPKKYLATAQIFVSAAGGDGATAGDLAQGNTFTESRVQSYISEANSPTVTDAVVSKLGLKISSQALADEVTADAPLDRVLINLHVRDGSAAQAAKLANAVAAEFSNYIEALERTNTSIASPVTLTITHPARVPGSPISPKAALDIGVAIILGLILGLGAVLLRELFDNSLKTPDQLADLTSLPVLGVVPLDRNTPDAPVSFRADAQGSRAESFRQMRTNLQFVDVDNPPWLIAVTSALPLEGKTHTALNLAATLAEAGQKVCLIEADLRKPTLAGILGVGGDAGLTSLLAGGASLDDVLQSAGSNLLVLVSGPTPPNPSELLESEAFVSALEQVGQRVDFVIVDTPPLLLVTDGAQVAALAHATVLVVRAGKTSRDQITRAMDTLAKVDVAPVGVVLNMAPDQRSDGYGHFSESYSLKTHPSVQRPLVPRRGQRTSPATK